MNAAQALAIAAAALVVSGDPWAACIADAEARLEALAEWGESAAREISADAATDMADESCSEDQHATRRLPDTSIHIASGAARL